MARKHSHAHRISTEPQLPMFEGLHAVFDGRQREVLHGIVHVDGVQESQEELSSQAF